MATNVLAITEDFSNATYWDIATGGVAVTADFAAAPAFAGGSAGMADKLEDNSSGAIEDIRSTFLYTDGATSITGDTSTWTCSIYLQKDVGAPSRFPVLAVQFLTGGTTVNASISMNLQTGATQNSGSTISSGFVDVDSLWYRFWFTVANINNTDVRVFIFPAQDNDISGIGDSNITGSIVAWGINLTNTSSVETYDPDPFYAFSAGSSPIMTAALPIFQ